MHFPDDGELFKCKTLGEDQNTNPLVFFAHFLGGNKKVLKRHISLMNELGYDAYVFNIKDKPKNHYYVPYSHVSKKFGLKHAIADQIEEHLDLLSDYKTKIVFAFSNIAACAIEALARRKTQDVIALICDSGPGVGFLHASYKLLEHQFKLSLPLRLIGTPLVMIGWSKDLHQDVPVDLKKLPEGFPILSIRGWKDKLILPNHIDQAFEPAKNVHWRKLALPEAEHLTGLRDFPSEYRSGLEDFLKTLN